MTEVPFPDTTGVTPGVSQELEGVLTAQLPRFVSLLSVTKGQCFSKGTHPAPALTSVQTKCLLGVNGALPSRSPV